MKIADRFLRSAIARRIMGYFAVAALLPLAAIAILSLDLVADKEFESILLAMAGVAALIVAVLGVTEICHTLRLLDDLREGARRMSEKEFSRTGRGRGRRRIRRARRSRSIRWRRASAANSRRCMTLADIDQAILSRLDLDRVIETVVMRMREVVPADYVSVAIVDRNAPAMVRIYTRDQSRTGRPRARAVRVFARGYAEYCSPTRMDSGSTAPRR